jgi:hypothetical protein
LSKIVFKQIHDEEEQKFLSELALNGNKALRGIFEVYELEYDSLELLESLRQLIKKMKPQKKNDAKDRVSDS